MRRLIWSFAAALVLVNAPVGLAQTPQVSLDIRYGPVLPLGDLAKVVDAGSGLGIGLLYRLSPSVQLRTDVHTATLPGAASLPWLRADITMWFIMFGVQANLVPGETQWDLLLAASAGLSLLDSHPFYFDEPIGPWKLNGEYFAAATDIEGAYRFSNTLAAFARAQLQAAFLGGIIRIFQEVDPSVSDSGPFLSVPIEFGIRFTF